AQPKAGNIAGCITICAEVNKKALNKRHEQGWVNEKISDLDELVKRVRKAKENEEIVSIGYEGNIVDVWEKFADEDIFVDLGSDQTSCHNPWAGGYYPAGLTYEEANRMMAENPEEFKKEVQKSLVRQIDAINRHTEKGTYFFDYGNAFLLEASRAGAKLYKDDQGRFVSQSEVPENSDFAYPSYVQDILGPQCFDYGFGPFRWVCTSGNPDDLDKTDQLALEVLQK